MPRKYESGEGAANKILAESPIDGTGTMTSQKSVGLREMAAPQKRPRGSPRRQRRGMVAAQIQARRIIGATPGGCILRVFAPQHVHDWIGPHMNGMHYFASEHFPTYTGLGRG